jgi:hypothetical protein
MIQLLVLTMLVTYLYRLHTQSHPKDPRVKDMFGLREAKTRPRTRPGDLKKDPCFSPLGWKFHVAAVTLFPSCNMALSLWNVGGCRTTSMSQE